MKEMKDETGVVTLAGKDYPCRALTFDELQETLGAIQEAGKPDMPLIDRMKCARTALLPSLGMTAEEFGKIQMDLPDIMTALSVVSQLTGLVNRAGETAAAKSA